MPVRYVGNLPEQLDFPMDNPVFHGCGLETGHGTPRLIQMDYSLRGGAHLGLRLLVCCQIDGGSFCKDNDRIG